MQDFDQGFGDDDLKYRVKDLSSIRHSQHSTQIPRVSFKVTGSGNRAPSYGTMGNDLSSLRNPI